MQGPLCGSVGCVDRKLGDSTEGAREGSCVGVAGGCGSSEGEDVNRRRSREIAAVAALNDGTRDAEATKQMALKRGIDDKTTSVLFDFPLLNLVLVKGLNLGWVVNRGKIRANATQGREEGREEKEKRKAL